MVRPLVLLIPTLACAAGPGSPTPPEDSPSPAPSTRDAGAKAAPPPPAPPIGEAHARQIVTRALRDAGLRVLFDYPVKLSGRELTLDGFDPGRAIGFEYVAPEERALAGTAPETGDDLHLLWLEPAGEAEVRRRTREFVADHLAPDAGPGED